MAVLFVLDAFFIEEVFVEASHLIIMMMGATAMLEWWVVVGGKLLAGFTYVFARNRCT